MTVRGTIRNASDNMVIVCAVHGRLVSSEHAGGEGGEVAGQGVLLGQGQAMTHPPVEISMMKTEAASWPC